MFFGWGSNRRLPPCNSHSLSTFTDQKMEPSSLIKYLTWGIRILTNLISYRKKRALSKFSLSPPFYFHSQVRQQPCSIPRSHWFFLRNFPSILPYSPDFRAAPLSSSKTWFGHPFCQERAVLPGEQIPSAVHLRVGGVQLLWLSLHLQTTVPYLHVGLPCGGRVVERLHKSYTQGWLNDFSLPHPSTEQIMHVNSSAQWPAVMRGQWPWWWWWQAAWEHPSCTAWGESADNEE